LNDIGETRRFDYALTGTFSGGRQNHFEFCIFHFELFLKGGLFLKRRHSFVRLSGAEDRDETGAKLYETQTELARMTSAKHDPSTARSQGHF
jgi:hypothetical protein